jgi:hypothetical protein
MTSEFENAADCYRYAETDKERRIAIRLWIVAALHEAQYRNEGIGPAIELLGALEGLDRGHVAGILKLPIDLPEYLPEDLVEDLPQDFAEGLPDDLPKDLAEYQLTYLAKYLPKNRRKKRPHLQACIESFALAAIDMLKLTDLTARAARDFVSDKLGMKPAKLEDLGKKMRQQSAKPKDQRTKYLDLIPLYDDELANMKAIYSFETAKDRLKSENFIKAEVIRLGLALGRAPSR